MKQVPPTSYYVGRAKIIEDQTAERGELISALHAKDAEIARLRSMLETRNRLRLDVCPTCGEIGEAVYYLGLYDDMEKEVIRLRKLVEEAYKEGIVPSVPLKLQDAWWQSSNSRKRLMEGKGE